MSGKDGGYELPEIVAPETITFCIEVPDEPFHLQAFWGALWTLTRWFNWRSDDDHTALAAAEVWRDLWFKNRLNWRERGCCTDDENCREYDAAEERATFYPTIDAEDLPLGYVVNPWVRITGNNPLVGLKTGDVITDLAHIPPLPSIWDHLEDLGTVLSLGYPSISITGLVGRGTVRVYLLSVLLGGRALIVRDNELLSTAFLDTNLDTVSLPPETYAENLIEYKFETSGDHRLDIVFVPNVSADIEFLGFGGGFRRVEICGFEENGMPTDYCCDETNDLLRKIVLMMESGLTADIRFGRDGDRGGFVVPDLIVDCTPKDFDGNEDDTGTVADNRESALCITVSRYIVAMLFNLAVEMNAGTTIKNNLKLLITPLALPNEFTSELTMPGIPSTEGGLAYLDIIALSHLATDMSTLVDDLICEMIATLTGKQNTFANFRVSVADTDAPTDEESQYKWLLYRFIKWTNEIRENFIIFSRQLESTFTEVEEGLVYECPCEGVIPEYPVLIAINPVGTFGSVPTALDAVITHVDVELGVFRVQQAVINPGNDLYIIQFKDQYNRCISVGAPPSPYEGTAQHFHWYVDCDNAEDEGTGGFSGAVKQIGVDYVDPVDTYFTVTLVP